MNGEPLSILHVEDDPDHARLIARILRQHRMVDRIHLVEDGRAALDWLLQRGDYQECESSLRPHLVLLDLRLPKIDGLEVLRVIKTTDRLLRIPVVILTSSNAEKDIAQAYEYRAASYLIKPVDFGRLMEMMENLGSYWLGWNRYPQPVAAAGVLGK